MYESFFLFVYWDGILRQVYLTGKIPRTNVSVIAIITIKKLVILSEENGEDSRHLRKMGSFTKKIS